MMISTKNPETCENSEPVEVGQTTEMEKDAKGCEKELQTDAKRSEVKTDPAIKSSKYRWAILSIFVLSASLTGMIFYNYIMFPNVLQEYFGISDTFITWTTLINMVVFTIMIIPVMGFLQRKTLRFIMLCATTCLVVGSALKCIIVPTLFPLIFIGQARVRNRKEKE